MFLSLCFSISHLHVSVSVSLSLTVLLSLLFSPRLACLSLTAPPRGPVSLQPALVPTPAHYVPGQTLTSGRAWRAATGCCRAGGGSARLPGPHCSGRLPSSQHRALALPAWPQLAREWMALGGHLACEPGAAGLSCLPPPPRPHSHTRRLLALLNPNQHSATGGEWGRFGECEGGDSG